MADTGFRSRIGGALGRIASVRVTLKSVTVLEASILGLIVVIGVIFRVMPFQYGAYLSTEADTSFQYRVTEYVVKNGYAAWFTWHDSLSWYPWGRNIPLSSFPGLPFTAALVYSILQFLGLNVSLYYVCLFFPILMAALTIIAVYFLGRDLGGGGVGLFAAFFMAISSAYISRTSFGFFDDETIGLFGIVIISIFFLRSLEKDKSWIRSVLYATAAGLILGYLSASWGAVRYMEGLLALFVFVAMLTKLYNRRYLVAYGLTLGFGFMIAVLVPRLSLSYILSADSMAFLGFFLFLVFYELIKDRFEFKKQLIISVATIGVLIVALLGLESLGVIYPIASKFIAVIFPQSRAASPIIQSIAEHKHAAWGIYFNDFGFTLGLALFSSYFVLRRVEMKRLFGLIFFLTAAYFAGSFVRLFLLLAIPVSLMAAYGLKELLSPFMSIASQRGIDRRTRRRKAMFGLSREFGIVFIVLIVLATVPTIWSASEISGGPSTMAATVPALIGGSYPQDWLQALNWMRDNLPNNAIVVSWWDYGYWIQTQANKTTLADGSTINTTQIAKIGKIMMFNQSESLKILKDFNATHIVVYVTFNPSNTGQTLNLGDEGKWYWMVKIAGLNETEYIGSEDQFTEKYMSSTLYNLMSNTANSTYFKPVYRSRYNWVLVYEINYPS